MRKFVLFITVISILSSCVSTKKYDELLAEKVKLSASNEENEDKLEDCNEDLLKTKSELDSAKSSNENLKNALKRSENSYASLDSSNTRLQNNYKDLLESSTKKSNQLAKNLAEKESMLIDLESTLRQNQKSIDSLANNLELREQKVTELENVLAKKDSAVQRLKDIVNDALLSFEKSDLSVEVKNGKVYVSLASKLLFKTGSIEIDKKGEQALIQLAKVLKNQKDVNVMVEGHTDTQKVGGSQKYMNDNWDLSVLRATSVLRILVKQGVKPTQIIAAGRGEFMPVDDSKSSEALRKNRRTEIILTPKLNELFQILEN